MSFLVAGRGITDFSTEAVKPYKAYKVVPPLSYKLVYNPTI